MARVGLPARLEIGTQIGRLAQDIFALRGIDLFSIHIRFARSYAGQGALMDDQQDRGQPHSGSEGGKQGPDDTGQLKSSKYLPIDYDTAPRGPRTRPRPKTDTVLIPNAGRG